MGCSKGITTTEIAELYPDSKVIGIDIIPPLGGPKKELHWKRRDKKGLYLIADGFYPPFKDGVFDAVFCMSNIYHRSLGQTKNAQLKNRDEIARTIKEKGFLLVSGSERKYGGYYNFVILEKIDGKFKVIDCKVTDCDKYNAEKAKLKLDSLIELFKA
jgi:ubiquinone/menaquinone biosynthesis C-methylase UbiE